MELLIRSLIFSFASESCESAPSIAERTSGGASHPERGNVLWACALTEAPARTTRRSEYGMRIILRSQKVRSLPMPKNQ